jgi:hypothetical protein
MQFVLQAYTLPVRCRRLFPGCIVIISGQSQTQHRHGFWSSCYFHLLALASSMWVQFRSRLTKCMTWEDGLEMHRLLLVTIGIVERSGNQLRDQSHFPDAATTLPVFNPCHRSSPSTEQQPSPLTLVCIPSFWPGKLISHYDESVMWLALCLLSIRPMPLVRRRPSPCSCIRRSSFSNLTSTATIDEARRFD